MPDQIILPGHLWNEEEGRWMWRNVRYSLEMENPEIGPWFETQAEALVWRDARDDSATGDR